MKRKMMWFLFNGLFAAGVYFAFVEQSVGAERVVIFYTWTLAVISLAYCTDEVRKTIKEKGRAIPKWIDVIFDLTMISTLVWFGAIFTGVAYLFHFLLHTAAFAEADKETVN